MTNEERNRRALEKIRDYDPDRVNGYTDEWTEAAGFRACQQIALEALDPAREEPAGPQATPDVELEG